MDMLNYVIIEIDLDLVMYFPYPNCSDIVQYYDVSNLLHSHDCVHSHHNLAVI